MVTPTSTTVKVEVVAMIAWIVVAIAVSNILLL